MRPAGETGSTRVLVTGASGLLGTWLLRTAPGWANVTAATRTRELNGPRVIRGDLRHRADADELVRAARPEVVVHAAYARDRSSIVEATSNTMTAADQVGACFVLISTDAVFAGDGRARGEHDVPDPVWDYGRWKVEAEQAAATRSDAGIVRLPLLVSLAPPDAGTRRVREAVTAGCTVGWFAGERRQPALAREVASAVWSIVALPNSERAGIWHLVGAERITRRDLGARVARALGCPDPGVEVTPPSPIERPHDLYLTGRRARDRIGWRPRPVTPEHLHPGIPPYAQDAR
jgi:dTDP-4-dehydrorhamnose reductase